VSCDAARHLISQAVPLVEEARALSFALSLTLASTPHQDLGGEEVDALCQLAYELQSKLTTAVELLHDAERISDH
jgi:hypothetical protein